MSSATRKRFGAEGSLEYLPIDPDRLNLITDPKNPLYDPSVHKPFDEATVLNMMINGVIEPIGCVYSGEDAKGEPIVDVVWGRGRTINLREANRRLRKEGKITHLMPCKAEKSGNVARLVGLMHSENIFRRGVSPMEKARGLQTFLDLNRDEKAASIQFGCSMGTIKNLASLLECDTKVQKAVENNVIPATVAYEIASLPKAEQVKRLDELVAAGVTKGAAAVAHVREAKSGAAAAQGKPEPAKKMRARVLVEAFKKKLGYEHSNNAQLARDVASWVLGGDPKFDGFDDIKAILDAATATKKRGAGKASKAKKAA